MKEEIINEQIDKLKRIESALRLRYKESMK